MSTEGSVDLSGAYSAADVWARWSAWLSRMHPETEREELAGRLRDSRQTGPALAELVTFALLDAVYPSVEINPASAGGKHTDFAVDEPVRTHFEVHRPDLSKNIVSAVKVRAAVVAELNKVPSPDFWLSVPRLSVQRPPAMKPIRHQVGRWLDTLDYEAALATAADRSVPPHLRWPRFCVREPGVTMTIRAVPREPHRRGADQFTVGTAGVGIAHVESAEDIQEALRDKLRQHAGLAHPLVLVLDFSSPIVADDMIAAALFGPVSTSVLPTGEVSARTRDRGRGLWPHPHGAQPAPAGLLVLRGIAPGFEQSTTAQLWLPPGMPSPLLPGPWQTRTLGFDDQSTTPQPEALPASRALGLWPKSP